MTTVIVGLLAAFSGGPLQPPANPAQPGPDAGITVSHRARAQTPGEVVLVSARTSDPLDELRAQWLGQTVLFAEVEDGRWEGLAPIDLSTAAGRYTLRLEGRTRDGRPIGQSYQMSVLRRSFPTRRLKVAPKFAEPPAEVLPRIERERVTTEAIFAAATPERFWSGPFVVPVPGDATSSFGRRSVVNGQPRSPHSGTDFQAATGTPVVAPNRGRVALAADLYFAGLTVILDHGAGVYSYLAHLSRVSVKEGEIVERGERIALTGASGRVTGPHLHWTLRIGKARIDPLSLVSVLKADAPRAGKAPRSPGTGPR